MEEITSNNYLSEISRYDGGNDKRLQAVKAEICDYAQHLEFHSKGFQVPHDVWQAAESSNGTFPMWDNPYYMTWDFNKKNWNIYFAKLVWRRRPGEDPQIKAYRANNWHPVTKVPISNVMSVLSKINKAKDYRVDWSNSEEYPNVPDKEQLEDYICEYYPEYASVENYVFSYLVRQLIANDPNSLIGVKELPREKTDIPRPFVYVYPSSDQVFFESGRLAIIKYDDAYTYKIADGKDVSTAKYEVWTKNEILYAYKGEDGYIALPNETITHNLGELPIWRPRGKVKDMNGITPVCLSYIDEMLPSLDRAAGILSDLDAEFVQHIYSTMWYYEGSDCTFCNGMGYSMLQGGNKIACSKCEGSGVMKKSPYKDIVMKLPKNPTIEGNPAPSPPAGYIEKSTDIAKLLIETVNNLMNDSLSAVNMQFLGEVPVAQSGIAKRYDRDEAYDFIHPVARFIIEAQRKIVYFINELRYKDLVPSRETRLKALPYIKYPEQFEIETSDMIAQEIKTLRDGKIDPTIIAEKEKQYAEKSFGDNKDVLAKIELQKKANPFPTMTNQEILDNLLAGAITEFDAVKSFYLGYFIETLDATMDDFLDMEFEKQIALIDKMTDAKVKERNKQNAARTIVKANIDAASNTQGA
jgi:hypothetical protein